MLSPLRRSALSQYSRSLLHQKSYATEASTAQSSSTSSRHAIPLREYLQRNQFLYIRCKDEHVHSMSGLLAILRGVEREFGRVRDYQFNRDPYDNERFQKWFRVRLEDPDLWERVPEGGKTMHVHVPVLRETRPGGLSISDVQELLHPQDRVADDIDLSQPVAAETQGKLSPRTKRVEVRVERSVVKELEQARWMLSKERRMKIGQAFVGWGGFYQPATPELTKEEESKVVRMLNMKERYGLPSDLETEATVVETQTEENVEIQAEEPEPEVEESVETEATAPELSPITTGSVDIQEASPTLESSSTSTSPSSAPPQTPVINPPMTGRAKRRQMLLELARKNAQKPLPETIRFEEPQEQKPSEEELKTEREDKRQAMRERVWKLMGGFLR